MPEGPPPYQTIARSFGFGTVVPFLGAGVSCCHRPRDYKFSMPDPGYPPDVAELTAWLARNCDFPEVTKADDLARVASYMHLFANRGTLTGHLQEVFGRPYPVGMIHEVLAAIPQALLIITTNYDSLMEDAYEARGRPFHLVTYTRKKPGAVLWRKARTEELVECASNELQLDMDILDAPVIFKIHGTATKRNGAAPEGFLITEDDYVDALASRANIPAKFRLHLQERSILFLGYSLRDWNLRVMPSNLRRQVDNEVTSWAIQYKPSVVEERLWRKRDVDIYDYDLNAFAEELAGHLSPAPHV